jgi:aminoglycoside phosphotransferase (APT) family kinase protein
MYDSIIAELFKHFGPLKTKRPIYVQHGYANEVFLMPDDGLVLRIPRNQWAADRQTFEANILDGIAKIDLGYTTSRVRLFSTAPPYMVTSYIEGHVYSRENMKAWDEELLVLFGKDLGTFLWNLHIRADKRDFANIIKQRSSLIADFEVDISSCQQKDSILYQSAQVQLDILTSMITAHNDSPVVVHGDIHAANIIFDDVKQMMGVLDFADLSIESRYVDFRRVYMLHPIIFEACIDSYELLSKTRIDRMLARQWAIVHEYSVLCRHFDEPNYPSIPRATEHINTWLA